MAESASELLAAIDKLDPEHDGVEILQHSLVPVLRHLDGTPWRAIIILVAVRLFKPHKSFFPPVALTRPRPYGPHSSSSTSSLPTAPLETPIATSNATPAPSASCSASSPSFCGSPPSPARCYSSCNSVSSPSPWELRRKSR